MGIRGAAEGLLNLAIRSLSEPETTRGLDSAGPGVRPGEEERELLAGGVRDDGSDLPSVKSSGVYPHVDWSTALTLIRSETFKGVLLSLGEGTS